MMSAMSDSRTPRRRWTRVAIALPVALLVLITGGTWLYIQSRGDAPDQSTEAVGRTDDVTGSVTIEGSKVTATTFTVDMATVASDESRRDNQFRGRIMAVSQFPTSTFTLTEPIELGSVPAVGEKVNVRATGDLTLRGTTKSVAFPLEAERTATGMNVAGSLPIVFTDWGIPNPSAGPARTEDRGELELLLVLGR